MPSQNLQNTNIIYPFLFSSTYQQMFNNEISIYCSSSLRNSRWQQGQVFLLQLPLS